MKAESMTREKQRWSDQRVEQIIGNLLRAGVIIAAAICLAGGVLYLVSYGHQPVNYHAFRSEPSDLRSVPGIFADAFALHSRGLMQLGLLLLILTPVVRVAFSIFAFALEHDRMYVVITSIVLGLLIFSLMGG
jgi:uncharacterized membrane protein